jgi:hypothetical protein
MSWLNIYFLSPRELRRSEIKLERELDNTGIESDPC